MITKEELKGKYSDFLRPFSTKKTKEALKYDRLGLIEVIKRDVEVFERQTKLIAENSELLEKIEAINTKPNCALQAVPEYPKLNSYHSIDFKGFIFSPYGDFAEIFDSFIFSDIFVLPFSLGKAVIRSSFRLFLSPFRFLLLLLRNFPIKIKNVALKKNYKSRVKKCVEHNNLLIKSNNERWEKGKNDRAVETLVLNQKVLKLVVEIQFLDYIRKKINTDVLAIPPKYNNLVLEEMILNSLINEEADNFSDAIRSVKTDTQFEKLYENQTRAVVEFMNELSETRAELITTINDTSDTLIREAKKTRSAVNSLKDSVDEVSYSISNIKSDIKDSLSSIPSEKDLERIVRDSMPSVPSKEDIERIVRNNGN